MKFNQNSYESVWWRSGLKSVESYSCYVWTDLILWSFSRGIFEGLQGPLEARGPVLTLILCRKNGDENFFKGLR